MTARRVWSTLLALVPWGLSALVLLASLLWGRSLRCDDHCSTTSPNWRDREDAWQWDALPVLGAIAFLAGTVFVACVWKQRPVGALVALATGSAAALVGGTWLVPGWHEHLARNTDNIVICALVFGAGVLAALLARPRTG